MPQLVHVVETRSSRASHLPVLHPEHLSSSATPFNAESMCRPQPAQVNRLRPALPQVGHGFLTHIESAGRASLVKSGLAPK